LFEIYCGGVSRALKRILTGLKTDEDGRLVAGRRPPRSAWWLFRSMLTVAGGRSRLSRAMEPA
jgi:hypothetical protein